MRTLSTILVFVLAVTFTAQAQKGKHRKHADFTPEQHATLMVKKMTLALDLTKAQQRKISPLVEEQVKFRAEARKMRAEHHANETKPTSEERFKFQEAQLDQQIAFKNGMKEILTEEQYEKFEKMGHRRKMREKRGMEQERRREGMKRRMHESRGW